MTIATPNTGEGSYSDTLRLQTSTEKNDSAPVNNTRVTQKPLTNTTESPYKTSVHTHVHIVNGKIDGVNIPQILAYAVTILFILIGIKAFFKWRNKKREIKKRTQIREYPPEYDEIYATQQRTHIPSAPTITRSTQNITV